MRAGKQARPLIEAASGREEALVVGEAEAAGEELVQLAELVAGEADGVSGLSVVQAALTALGRLDEEHAAVYFQIIWNALREPVRKALEALVMERQTQGKAKFPPFAQELIDRGRAEGEARALLTVLRGRGIAVPEAARDRILAQNDLERLERWLERAIVAASLTDVLDDPS